MRSCIQGLLTAEQSAPPSQDKAQEDRLKAALQAAARDSGTFLQAAAERLDRCCDPFLPFIVPCISCAGSANICIKFILVLKMTLNKAIITEKPLYEFYILC